MMTQSCQILVCLFVDLLLFVVDCFGPVEVQEEAGYVEVRPGAHQFWLLQYSSHAEGYQRRPWVLWLQGGPGVSGTGVGNLFTLGPEDVLGNQRTTTWLQSVSLLYVDYPIPTGFSYLDPGTQYSYTYENTSQDLVFFLSVFLQEHREFADLPLYIFGVSYGGKLAPAFAYYLEQSRQQGLTKCNLKAVCIGNGYVSPLDMTRQMGKLLHQMSWIDDITLLTFQGYTRDLEAAVANGRFASVSSLLTKAANIAPDVSYYNVLVPPEHWYKYNTTKHVLIERMNGEFRRRFPVIPDWVEWAWMNEGVQKEILEKQGEVLRPVYHLVDALLVNSSVQVVVYSGQYDALCSTSGALSWIHRLTWPELKAFYYRKQRLTLQHPITGQPEMYVRARRQLKFYWVLNAGHDVVLEVPEVALRMLQRIITNMDI